MSTRPRLVQLFAGILCALCLAPLAAAKCTRVLTVAASDYGPYMHMDKNGNWRGIDVEILSAVFKEAGCSFRFAEQVAPKRMLPMVAEGKIDIMLAVSDTPERRAAHIYGPAYREEQIALVGIAGSVGAYKQLKSLDDLKQQHVRLLIPNTGWYGAEYGRMQPVLRAAGLTVEYTYFDQGIRMLRAGRAQLMLGDPAALLRTAKGLGIALEALPYIVNKTPVHMVFSKASVPADDARQIIEATQRLERRGELQALIARSRQP